MLLKLNCSHDIGEKYVKNIELSIFEDEDYDNQEEFMLEAQ